MSHHETVCLVRQSIANFWTNPRLIKHPRLINRHQPTSGANMEKFTSAQLFSCAKESTGRGFERFPSRPSYGKKHLAALPVYSNWPNSLQARSTLKPAPILRATVWPISVSRSR